MIDVEIRKILSGLRDKYNYGTNIYLRSVRESDEKEEFRNYQYLVVVWYTPDFTPDMKFILFQSEFFDTINRKCKSICNTITCKMCNYPMFKVQYSEET